MTQFRPQTTTDDEEPRSARLVAWGNAWLTGAASPDDAAEAVRGDDATHLVEGLPGADRVGLTLALGRLRALGATGLRLALPVPGHPLGLTGPAEFNARALDAGEAVLAVGTPWGLVPRLSWHGAPAAVETDAAALSAAVAAGDGFVSVVWEALPTTPGVPADVPQLRDAERELAQAMREAIELLARLDVAGGPGADAHARDALRRMRGDDDAAVLAPGYPAAAVRVLASARRVSAVVAVAGRSQGAAVSAAEMGARELALRPLARSARRARVAAYNAIIEAR